MKKLNITKKQYDESKYFNKKYGALKFVSESGKLYKTDKGVVLALEGTEEPMKEDGDSIMDRQLDDNKEADKKEGGYNEDITRSELTDMLKDVVKEVEKVCDAQDLSFEEVAGIEKPEGESDEEADKDEVVATKDEVAEVLAGVIDTVEKVADQNDIELPEEDDDEKEEDDDDEVTVDEGCDCGKKDCPECNPDQKPATEGCEDGECCPTCGAPMKKECGSACECGDKEPAMESRKARAKLVREAIARRARVRKLRESRERRERREKIRKVMESIRRRRAAKKVLESIRRRRAAKKMMESRKQGFKKLNSAKKVLESRRIRARKAGMSK